MEKPEASATAVFGQNQVHVLLKGIIDFDEEKKTFSYIVGDVVTSLDEIPHGLIPFEIPAIKYAVFPIHPKNRFAWGEAIASLKKYAFTVWLPNSKYEPAKIIDDVEYHDERSLRKENPESDLYVAIKEKTGTK